MSETRWIGGQGSGVGSDHPPAGRKARAPDPRSQIPDFHHQPDHRLRSDGRFVPAVNDVSFSVGAGETLCLVGESGSGKSLTALSIMRLIQAPGRIAAGQILFQGAGSADAARAGDAEGARREIGSSFRSR